MLAENLTLLRNIRGMTQEEVAEVIGISRQGQIVIPKAARDTFHLSEGDRLVVLGDEEQGIALIKAEVFEERMQEALRAGQKSNE